MKIFWKYATMENSVENIKKFTSLTRQNCKVKDLKFNK